MSHYPKSWSKKNRQWYYVTFYIDLQYQVYTHINININININILLEYVASHIQKPESYLKKMVQCWCDWNATTFAAKPIK